MKRFNHLLIPILLAIGLFIIYKNIYPEPRNWYDHYLHLSKSLLSAKVDVPNLPEFYHDKIIFNDKILLPFPPGASIALIPFLKLNPNITQQLVSILIGSANVGLLYMLLSKITSKIESALLSIFYGLGTVAFWSAVVGTTWYFAHTVAVFYLLVSLLLHFSKRDVLSGIFFALSVLTRLPILMAGIFFLLQFGFKNKRLFLFLIGTIIFVPIMLGYNYFRFGDILMTGYDLVYHQYADSNYQVSIGKYFNYFDIRNIPLHLYTFLIMPPDIIVSDGFLNNIKPSSYGMGILFTSPLLLITLLPKFKKGLEFNSIFTAGLISVLVFMHYAQGWVQFGYRFVMDFIVFLMIVLALRFKINKITIALVLISVIVNFWGVLWAIKLGW